MEKNVFLRSTGSDVSILSKKLVKRLEQRILKKDCYLKYPTGEEVPILFEIIVSVDLGKYSNIKVPLLVADISDECILGVDLKKKINLEEIFNSVFGNQSGETLSCSRIVSAERVPYFLEEFFIQN